MSHPGMAGPADVRVASIHIYPMKAARAVSLAESPVEPCGLAGDRRWLLTDESGVFLSQREEPPLALVTVRYGPRPGEITVSAPGCGALAVPAPGCGAPLLKVSVWNSVLVAAAAGPEPDAWFSGYLGRPVRLVYLDDPARRPVDPEFGQDGDVVSFADGYPLLLTSAGSLEELGRWLAADGGRPVPMTRFRPNVVVTGAPPWAEDRWRRIRIGDVSFRVAKPCGRCVVTTIDQDTGERGREPLMMLGRRRRFGKGLVFGQNLIPDAGGVIRIGDRLVVLE
jgi:uncharacterized protein YcbX